MQSQEQCDLRRESSQHDPRSGPPPEGLEGLIVRQCRLAPAETGAIFRLRDGGAPELVALHPQVTGVPDWLRIAAREAGTAGGSGGDVPRRVVSLPSDHAYYGGQTRRLLITPLPRPRSDETLVGAWVVEAVDADLAGIAERIEAGAAWLELRDLNATLAQREASLDAITQVMEAVGVVAAQVKYRAAAHVICNVIAQTWSAERVALGFRRGRRAAVDAISHTEKISRRMGAVQVIEAAMEEAMDQETEVTYPADPAAGVICRACRDLAMSQPSAPMTAHVIPMITGAGELHESLALLSIERPLDNPWTTEERAALRLLADTVAPVLVTRRRADAWIGARTTRAIRRALAWGVGAEHTWIKAAALLVLISLAFLFTVPGTYRVRSTFRIEADRMQVVTAPFEGFIREVEMEVGDIAEHAGTLLARLDDTEQKLELASAGAELASTKLEIDVGLREGDHAAARAAQLRSEQLEARIALLQYDIDRAALITRQPGVVLSGDLKDRINAPVHAGEVLFEVAPIEDLRADVFVAEDQVNDVRVGQRGELSTAALPEHRIGFTVRSVDPVAEVIDDENRFRVRVALDELPTWLRPGMEGVARIDIDQRLYPAIWSRRLVNWVRMKLWI
ncbi:MAG: HlyD family efflux transporter periplasmic adaptor subunit [Phycisphaerales bacterium]|nr:HlyD family efflux transporter periplasmic adaptor subunit [Phycisphaerales bacterium]